jgi:hypothetical protein
LIDLNDFLEEEEMHRKATHVRQWDLANVLGFPLTEILVPVQVLESQMQVEIQYQTALEPDILLSAVIFGLNLLGMSCAAWDFPFGGSKQA